MTTHITIRKPDDWHCHMRDGEMLKAVSTGVLVQESRKPSFSSKP